MKSFSSHRLTLLLILLVAAAIRLIGLNNGSPPGLEHDEVANWLIDQAILEGNHAVYFTEAYGHEAGFHYWQTLFVALVGDHALALRLPAALMGLLVVAVTYTLNKKLFGRSVATWAMALGAVLFTAVFFSRLGLRAISLPFVAGLSAYFFWRYWSGENNGGGRGRLSERQASLVFLLLAAVFGGLSLYTYLASRAVPLFYGAFFAYLMLFHWPEAKKRWVDGVIFSAVFGTVVYPLLHFLGNNPAAEFRVGEVNLPLNALLDGNPQPVVQNLWKILLGFGVTGDPLWRQGVADLPIFEVVGAVGFYIGIVILLRYLQSIHYAFVGLWISCAVVPSLVTVDAPSTIRMILWLPFLVTVPVLGWQGVLSFLGRFGRPSSTADPAENRGVIHNRHRLSTGFPQLSTDLWKKWGINLLTLGILVVCGARTNTAVFVTWPQNEEVRFVWQATLTEMGRYLDARPEIEDAAVVGWSPDTMDRPTMLLSRSVSEAALRHIGTVGEARTLVLSAGGVVLQPHELPLDGALAAVLQDMSTAITSETSFVAYQLPADIEVAPDVPADALFSEELRFLGHDVVQACESGVCVVRTYWLVEKRPAHGRRFFLHGLDEAGGLVAQDDSLHAPPEFWIEGDMLVHVHVLPMIEEMTDIRLGVYDPTPPFPRLTVLSGADHVALFFDLPE